MTLTEYLSETRSNQPHLLFLPVTTPYSAPFSIRKSPTSFSCSVKKGPVPTLDMYALVTPTILSISRGPIPEPIAAFPAVVFELVTKGYVP